MNKIRNPAEIQDCPFSGDCESTGKDYTNCGFRREYICTREPVAESYDALPEVREDM